MNAFARAVDAIFRDPNMSTVAGYIERGVLPARPVRVARRQPDRMANFGDGRFVSDSVLLDVRIAEVPILQRGDRFQIGDVIYEVRSEPLRDSERLTWAAECREEPRAQDAG